MPKVKSQSTAPEKKVRPALTPEADQNQLISLAVDLVRQRLLNGTATSQETTHFLKMASSDYKLKVQKLEEENKLLRAKTEAIESAKDAQKMYMEAIKAMRIYQGQGDEEEYDY